jgi:hypothetical protein
MVESNMRENQQKTTCKTKGSSTSDKHGYEGKQQVANGRKKKKDY